MGHSEGINRDVYQRPLALKEITEVGSFLNTLDKGASQMAPNEGIIQELTEQRKNSENDILLDKPENCLGQEIGVIHHKDLETNRREDSETSKDPARRKHKLPLTRDADITDIEGQNIDADLPSKEPRAKLRRYRHWSKIDAAKVTSYFANFIDDIHSSTTSK